MAGVVDGVFSSTNGTAFSLSANTASTLAVHGVKVAGVASGEVVSFFLVILQ